MTTRTKILFLGLAVLISAVGVSVSLALRGIDASGEDPNRLFMTYVQNPIPPEILVESADGHANFGGTWIVFQLKLAGRQVDDLISAKGLRRRETVQTNLFPEMAFTVLKRPEYFITNKDMTWSKIGTTAILAVDRDAGIAFYVVYSP